MNGERFKFIGISSTSGENTSEQVPEFALHFLDAPYLWGGRSIFGIDCSGLTNVVFKMAGIHLRRDAWQQSEQGILVSFIDEARPGDLAFFNNEEGKIVHTGIILDQKKIIHASGRVRIDTLDHYGIFNEEQKRYTHQLRLIKRMIG
jgi:cell wall-associated NlpC family hydrolase